ncbi:MAG: tRNA uridine-5-carboxymethylaminomethyl(34) synthesis enzyme MnmG, partial [Desulfovibrionales bacterium]|nr:tRNA uridine-5-carboxymethylaminomethyl(34) synthesis enzyme MnmG [Desulfovibrionales bacterium]
LEPFWSELKDFDNEILEQVQTEIKFEGYLKRQEELVRRAEYLENYEIPWGIDFRSIPGLSAEVIEKLSSIQPRTLGQAGRISGVTPAALSSLEVFIRACQRRSQTR